MHAFAEKPKATQHSTSLAATVLTRPHAGYRDRPNSISHLQRTPSDHSAQRPLEENARQPNGGSTIGETLRPDHDFSRISVHPASAFSRLHTTANDRDMRGEGEREGDEQDQRVEAPPAPDHRLLCRASATGVSLGASGPINDGTKYGLRTPIIVRGTELADVLDSELVGASIDHTGSMTSRPSARSNNSGFMPADNIPDDRHTSGISDHLSYFDSHGGDGSYARLQMDLYKIPSCNITTPWPIPNSGYRIKREVKAEGSKVVGIVTKTAEDVTIDGHTTTAGLTPIKQAKVTLRG